MSLVIGLKQFGTLTVIAFAIGCSAEPEATNSDPIPEAKTVEVQMKDGNKIAVTVMPEGAHQMPPPKK